MAGREIKENKNKTLSSAKSYSLPSSKLHGTSDDHKDNHRLWMKPLLVVVHVTLSRIFNPPLIIACLSMALSSCFAYPQISPKIDGQFLARKNHYKPGISPTLVLALQGLGPELSGRQVPRLTPDVKHGWCFLGGVRVNTRSKAKTYILSHKNFGVCYSWLANPQIASHAFTWGTAAVLPFYTLMIVAPRAELTKKTMRSSIPYIVLGVLYAYLLYLSWTPETIRLMFASKYWLPELQGIAKMFSSKMTLASAWIHLLVIDLFAARQVYQDGLEKRLETQHSVSMCLLFCPIGILSHLLTTMLTRPAEKTRHSDQII